MLLKISKSTLLPTILFTCLAGAAYAADGTTHVLGAKKVVLDATTDTVRAGYYSTTTLHEIDPALKAENIALSTAIFGIAGTYAGGTSYALPDAGQTTSFTATYGEDHDYTPAATQLSYSSATINGDAVTIDNRTGLMWAQKSDKAGCANGDWLKWDPAVSYCQGLVFAGFGTASTTDVDPTGWRLPNVKELMSIMNFQRYDPTIDTTYFTSHNTQYWTSNTLLPMDDNAYAVNFSYGEVSYHSKTSAVYTHAVRCVRAGP